MAQTTSQWIIHWTSVGGRDDNRHAMISGPELGGPNDNVHVVEVDQLISPAEIAKMCSCTTTAVTNWSRRHADFPKPVKQFTMGPVYDWREIEAWLTSHDVRVPLSSPYAQSRLAS